jgi:hypothetical protein
MNAYAPFDLLFDLKSPCLSPELAQRLVQLKSDPASSCRMEELAALANEGELNSAEKREYESAVRATTLISVLQAKARLYLKQTAQGS